MRDSSNLNWFFSLIFTIYSFIICICQNEVKKRPLLECQLIVLCCNKILCTMYTPKFFAPCAPQNSLCHVHTKILYAMYTPKSFTPCTHQNSLCHVHTKFLCAMYTPKFFTPCTHQNSLRHVHNKIICAMYTTKFFAPCTHQNSLPFGGI